MYKACNSLIVLFSQNVLFLDTELKEHHRLNMSSKFITFH